MEAFLIPAIIGLTIYGVFKLTRAFVELEKDENK